MLRKAKSTEKRGTNKRNKKIFFGNVLFVTLCISVGIVTLKNFGTVNTKKAELNELKQVEETLRIRNEELMDKLKAEIDDDYIKQVVKEKLGYREPNSIMFYIHLE